MKIQNRPYLFPLLIVLVFLFSYSYTFDKKLAPLGDNASYYMLGQALSQGEGFVNISKVDKTPNNHYPPGYPAILSVFMQFTDSVLFMKLLNGLFLIGSLLLIYRIGCLIIFNPVISFIAVLLCLFNFHLLQYGSMMMSEIPFLFFSVLGIWLYLRYDHKQVFFKDLTFWMLLIVLIVAYYIRSLGVGLVGAAVIALLLKKEWKPGFALGAGAFVLALPWFIRSQQLGGGSYIKQLTLINPYRPSLGEAGIQDFADRILRNFSRYITEEIPNALFPFTEVNYQESAGFGEWIGGLVIVSIIVYGLAKFPAHNYFLLFYVLFTFLILLIWPDVWVGVRFIVPLIPVFALGFLNGVYSLLEMVFIPAKKPVPVWGLVIVPLFLIPSVNELHEQSSAPLHPAWQNYYAMGTWLRSQESPDVVVSCGKPALFYLYSRSFTMRYPFEQDAEKLIRELENEQVDYVVIDQVYPNTFRYLLPAIRTYPDRFEQVYHLPNPDTFLLRFKR